MSIRYQIDASGVGQSMAKTDPYQSNQGMLAIISHDSQMFKSKESRVHILWCMLYICSPHFIIPQQSSV